MLIVYVLNKNWLITHHICIYTLYLHYLYYFFTLFIAIYSFCYLYYIYIYTFFCGTVFLTQCIILFADKCVVLPLLLQNLNFSCSRSRNNDPARDCITHNIKVCAYKNNNDINNNNDSNNNKITIVIMTIIIKISQF